MEEVGEGPPIFLKYKNFYIQLIRNNSIADNLWLYKNYETISIIVSNGQIDTKEHIHLSNQNS